MMNSYAEQHDCIGISISHFYLDADKELACSDHVTGGGNIALGHIRNSYFIYLPSRSYDPGSMLKKGLPVGGVNFKTKYFNERIGVACLSYKIFFADNFEYVKGGKLPGLFGGRGNTGGNLPNGFDGFSVRINWDINGKAKLYAYLPTSELWGTAFDLPGFKFKKGGWTSVSLKVKLNDVGFNNGHIKFSSNSYEYKVKNLNFRASNNLFLDGVIFSIFYGGNNLSFAPIMNNSIEIRDISVKERQCD